MKSFRSVLFIFALLFNSTLTLAAQENQGKHHPMMTKPADVMAPAPGEVQPLDGGKTIEDIYAGSAELDGQTVSLRAKVVKVSKNIMGLNWITLQDGSSSEANNSLMATSGESVSPGDIIIASGTVHTDVDIGAGYEYKVLIRETTFSTETSSAHN